MSDWENLYWEKESENKDLRERLTTLEWDFENIRGRYARMKSAYDSFAQQRKTWEATVEELERELERREE